MTARVQRVSDPAPKPITEHKTKLAAARASAQPLLITRTETGRMLNISLSTVLVLEQKGKLTPVRLVQNNGQVHHRVSEVMALAEGDR